MNMPASRWVVTGEKPEETPPIRWGRRSEMDPAERPDPGTETISFSLNAMMRETLRSGWKGRNDQSAGCKGKITADELPPEAGGSPLS